MQPNEYRKQKAEAVAKCCYSAAQAVGIGMRALYNASRKKPRLVSKNTNYRSRALRKRRIGLLTASVAMQQAMSVMQLQMILSQPYTKISTRWYYKQ